MKKYYATVLILISALAYAQAPVPPVLNMPAHEATVNGITTSLDWLDVAGETGYIYQIDVTTAFNSPRLVTLTLNSFSGSGNPTITLSNLSFGTAYYWRVATQNGTAQSAWTETRSFTTVAYPTLSAPEDGALIHSAIAQLRWDDVDGETGYLYQIDTVSTFDSENLVTGTIQAHSSGASSPFITANDLVQDVVYYWRVAILNNSTQSAWSPVWTFSTDNPSAGTDAVNAHLYTLYPNPAREVLNVSNLRGAANFTINSIEGRKVLSGTTDATSPVNLSSLPTGLYLITLETDGQKTIKKFIKQ